MLRNALTEVIILIGWAFLLLAGLDLALSIDPYHQGQVNAPVLAVLGLLIAFVGHRRLRD